MKDIHDANISFWSPQPYFIAAFFFPQQIFQVAWLYRLHKLDPKKREQEKREVNTMLDFVPFYIVGNLCIASKLGLNLRERIRRGVRIERANADRKERG